MPFEYSWISPDEYGGAPQNWRINEDSIGRIFIANSSGVIVYDGHRWSLVKTLTEEAVTGVDIAGDGVVYVSGVGEFGFIEPDEDGDWIYRTLVDSLPDHQRLVGEIWNVHAVDRYALFMARDQLYVWDGTQLSTIAAKGLFHNMFEVAGEIYIRDHGYGLVQFEAGRVRLAKHGSFFSDLPIYAMFKSARWGIVVGTRRNGFFELSEEGLQPIESYTEYLGKDFRLYGSVDLEDGYHGVYGVGYGMAVFDPQGAMVARYTSNYGLHDDVINDAFLDSQGRVWLAYDEHGIAQFKFDPAASVYGRENGLDGAITAVVKAFGAIIVGTSSGLYVQHEDSIVGELQPQFESIGRIEQVSSICTTERYAFVVTNYGLYSVNRRGTVWDVERLSSDRTAHCYATERGGGGVYIYRSTEDYVVHVESDGNGWRRSVIIKGLVEGVTGVAEYNDRLWVGTRGGKLYNIGLGVDDFIDINNFSYVMSDSAEIWVSLALLDGMLMAATPSGIYAVSPDSTYLYRDIGVSLGLSGVDGEMHAVAVDNESDISWILYSNRIDVIGHDGALVQRTYIPTVGQWQGVLGIVQTGGRAWVGNNQHLTRVDLRRHSNENVSYPVHIARLYSFSDSVVAVPSTSSGRRLVLANSDNDVAVEFAAPQFRPLGASRYQFYLEGREDEWQAWTELSEWEYHDLREGDYTFHVRAQSADGRLSEVASFSFTVLPPWYRTWWAYLAYATVVLSVLAGIYRYRIMHVRTRRLEDHARELARERTLTKRLQLANETLRRADAMKDELLANTSHELRTPITAILGFAAVLRDEVSEEQREFVGVIESSSQRLLRTVNELLDFSTLAAGRMEIDPVVMDVCRSARDVVATVAPLAEEKGLALVLEAEPGGCWARLDPQRVEQVLLNLVGNAIKFTEAGSITVFVMQSERQVFVRISDTGIGISPDFLPHLFEAFRQESGGLARTHSGNGLGLAITSRLVGLMDGRIEVSSEPGVGSVFTVIFPRAEISGDAAASDGPVEAARDGSAPDRPAS